MNFWGDHAVVWRMLHAKLGTIIPSSMFFRITNPNMERALIHSDREYGERTAIVYLSPESTTLSGTAFYKHKQTGLAQMPALADLMADAKLFEQIKIDMLKDDAWEVTDFIPARYNRCVVFDAPLIHCRIPTSGYGTTDSDSRMVWVGHFNNAK